MFPNSDFAVPTGSFNVPIPPPVTDPDSSPYTNIRVSCEWLPFIRACLQQLLLQASWDTDAAGLEQVQYRAGRLMRMFGDEACEMCDCLEFTGNTWNRFVPDGHGGGTFEPVDPRTDGDVPPPWPTPPSGQTGECLSAANIEKLFQTMMEDMSSKLAILAEVGSILVAFEQYLALALGPLGEVVEIATEMAVAVVSAGAAATASAFDPATQTAAYDGIRCLMQCHMNADGSIDATQIAAIKAEFFILIDGWVADSAENALWRILFPDFLDSQGKNGLTLMGKLAGINSADCSGCSCGWCYVSDFTAGDFTIWNISQGTYVPGTGLVNSGGGPYPYVTEVRMTIPVGLTYVEFVYDRGTAEAGTGSGIYYSPTGGFVAGPLDVTGTNLHMNTSTMEPTQTEVLCQVGNSAHPSVNVIKRVIIHGVGTLPFGPSTC